MKFTFGEQLLEGVPCQRATDLQPLRHNSGGDELVVGNFFVQLVVGRLVEEDQVVELIPHFSLGPLLLRNRHVVLKTGKPLALTFIQQPHNIKYIQYGQILTKTYLLLGFASRLVDWVLVLLGLPSILLLILFRRLEKDDTR